MATEANNLRAITPGGMPTRQASENRRYVVLVQLLLAAGVFYVIERLSELIWRAAALPSLNPFGVHIGYSIALAVTGAAFIYTMRNVVAQTFADEVAVELRKVTWPTWKETRQATIVVIIVVAIIAAILGLFDLIWAKLIKFLLSYGASS